MQRTLIALCATSLLVTAGATFADEESPVIATVNGQTITEIDRDTQIQQFIARGQQANDEQVVEELITLELMRQEALKQGLDKTPQMAAEMKIMEARVLANTLLNNLTETVDTSDAALRAEYDKQISINKVEEYNASHILLEDADKAKEIIAELNGGADFADTAKKYSTGPSGENGGELGWFESAAMVPEFSAATSKLEVGKYSAEPIQTEFGFHVIMLNDKRSKEPQPFAAVKDQVRGMLLQSKVAEYVDSLREAATIEKQ